MRFTLSILGIYTFLLAGPQPARVTGTPVLRTAAMLRSAVKETTYSMSHSPQVEIKLAGTMPLHDWTMSAHGLTGEARMDLTSDVRLVGISSLTFALPVRNLKGESEGMENDCYKALKADRFPEIVFQLTSATIEPRGAGRYHINGIGNLTVAGVTRPIIMTMEASAAPDGSMIFTGSQSLKMSDYRVERPSLFFGAIKAGDTMTLTYTLIFEKHYDHAQNN